MFWKKKTEEVKEDPHGDFSSIGNVLRHMGLLTKEDLEGLIEAQKQQNNVAIENQHKFGELAILYGFITVKQLTEAITLQENIRSSSGVDKLKAIRAVHQYNIDLNKKTLEEKQRSIDLVLREVTH